MKSRLQLLLLVGLLLLLVTPTAAQEEPYFPTTEWRASTPEAQGMSSAEIAALFETFSQPHFNLDSLLVARHGVIVAEAYAPPFAQGMKHQLASVTKSLTGTLVGVMLQQGLLETPDAPLLSFLPDRTAANLDASKEAITIGNLLTMTSGLECDELTQASATTIAMTETEDWVQFALDLSVPEEPGTAFHYCNAAVHLLSAVIGEVTGMSAVDYAAEHLFAPLGITDYAWTAAPEGTSVGFAELYLNTRDLAKIGLLYLNGGQWDGQQIIPADFAEAAIRTQVQPGWPNTGYGYLWWTFTPSGSAIAVGFAGQYILIDPAKDLVVVLTGTFNEMTRFPVQYLPLAFTVMGLTTGDEAVPEDAAASGQLEAVLDRIDNPTPVEPAPLPPLAEQLSAMTVYLGMPLKIDLPSTDPVQNEPGVMIARMRWDFSNPEQAVVTLNLEDGRTWVLPINLTGIYAVSESPMGLVVGARGEWRTDSEFTFFIKYAGGEVLVRVDCLFYPGGIQVRTSESSRGSAAFMPGIVVPS